MCELNCPRVLGKPRQLHAVVWYDHASFLCPELRFSGLPTIKTWD